MQVMTPSGSVVLYFHSLQMFNEVPFLSTSSGCVKAKGTVENALTPEKAALSEMSERPTCYTFQSIY